MEFVLLVVLLSLVVWFAFAAGGWCDELIEWNYRRQCPPLPPANNEKDLERWHDAYDAAILEGKDEVEAVRCADVAVRPVPDIADQMWKSMYPVRKYMPAATMNEMRDKLWYTSLQAQYPRSEPLPGEPGGMGAIEADGDGTIKLRWNGQMVRMSTEEWIRRGRPGAQEAITGQRNPLAPPILGSPPPVPAPWQDPVFRSVARA